MNLKKSLITGALALSLVCGGLYGGFRAFADNEEKKKETTEETLKDEKGKVVYKFKSQAEAEKIIGKLKAGKKYRIREVKAPDGYVKSEPIELTVNKDGKEQEIKVVNDFTKVDFSKTDITGEKELPGAKLKVVDSEGRTVEEWETDGKPHRINKMKVGKYKLIEEIAPDGYVIANEVEFEVKETGEVQKVVMKDDTTKVKVQKVGSDDETKQLEGADFEIVEVEDKND